MAYTINTQRRADADIHALAAWRARRGSASSVAPWQAGLIAAVQTLATNPERCPLADEAADLGLDLRELVYGRRTAIYRILFTIDGETVNIHRIRHAFQDRLTADDL